MAKAKKYSFNYADLETQYTVEIWVEGYSGSVIQLDPWENPCSVSVNKSHAENYLGGVVPTIYTIQAESTSQFNANLFTSQNYGDVTIIHKTGGTIDWEGILVPFVSKDIDSPNGLFGTQLIAECGLNYLKSEKYTFTYGSRIRIIDVVEKCLEVIPHVTNFSYSIVDNVKVNDVVDTTNGIRYWEAYISEENFAERNYFEVLEDVLQGIRELYLDKGKWTIRNLVEINRGDTTEHLYSNAGVYVSSSSFTRPVLNIDRLSGTLGREFSHKDLLIRKRKSTAVQRFGIGEFNSLTGWTANGSAGTWFTVVNGELYNNKNTWYDGENDSASYLQNTTGVSYYPYNQIFNLQDISESVVAKIKARNGLQIQGLRFQIIAQQNANVNFFLTTEGTWYLALPGASTPIYFTEAKSDSEITIDIPKPPYIDNIASYGNLIDPFGGFLGWSVENPPSNIEYKLFIRVFKPKRKSSTAQNDALEENYIDYIKLEFENTQNETFAGFERKYGVENPRDKTGKLEIDLNVGYNTHPNGAETLYKTSSPVNPINFYAANSFSLGLNVADFVSKEYLDVLAIRHKNYEGTIYGKLHYGDFIEIDSVKYRIHDLKRDYYAQTCTIKAIELTSASTTPATEEVQQDQKLLANIRDVIRKNDDLRPQKLIVNDRNIRYEINKDGLTELRLTTDPTFDSISLEDGVLNLLKEGTATPALNWIDLERTVTDVLKPITDGWYLKAENNSALNIKTDVLTADRTLTAPDVSGVIATDVTAWMLGGNTVGAKETIGTINNFGFGIKTNNVERITVLNNGNVGIGTISPSQKLDVVGTGRFTNTNAYPLEINRGLNVKLVGTAVAGIRIGALDGTTYKEGAVIFGQLAADGNNGGLILQVRNNNVMTTFLTAISSGNVGIGTNLPAYKLDVTGTGRFTGAVQFDAVPSSLVDATSANHLVRYSQWIASTSVKYLPTPVRTVALTNITLSGTQTVSGAALVVGDRVLVMGQTTASQNGIYVVAAGAWTRATDSDTDVELRGFIINVSAGTYAGYKYINTNGSVITIGTTAITYAEFSNLSEIDPVFVSWRDTSRTANTFYAAPNGSSGAGTFRQIVADDIPSLLASKISDFETAWTANYDLITKNTAFNKNFGIAAGTVAEGNHTHTFASITNKPTTIAGYGITDYNTLWDAKMNTFIGAAPLALDTWMELVNEIQSQDSDITGLLSATASNTTAINSANNIDNRLTYWSNGKIQSSDRLRWNNDNIIFESAGNKTFSIIDVVSQGIGITFSSFITGSTAEYVGVNHHIIPAVNNFSTLHFGSSSKVWKQINVHGAVRLNGDMYEQQEFSNLALRSLAGWRVGDVLRTGVDVDFATYSVLLKGWDESGNDLTYMHENIIDPIDGRWYKINTNGTRKKYLLEGEVSGGGDVPTLDAVLGVGNTATKHIRYNVSQANPSISEIYNGNQYVGAIDTYGIDANTRGLRITSNEAITIFAPDLLLSSTGLRLGDSFVDFRNFANEAAAQAAGLIKGNIYHTNGALKIVTT